MMDSSFGSRKIQTFKKLPTIAPNIIEIRCHIARSLNIKYGESIYHDERSPSGRSFATCLIFFRKDLAATHTGHCLNRKRNPFPFFPVHRCWSFIPAAGDHGLWPWRNAPSYDRNVAPRGVGQGTTGFARGAPLLVAFCSPFIVRCSSFIYGTPNPEPST
jgi:hypothetical protein